MRPLLAILLGALLAAGSPAAFGPGDGGHVLSRDWKRLTTPSLTVVGNARDGDLRRAGIEMERFRRALGSLAAAVRLDAPVPTVVVVFRDDAAFNPFKPRYRGRINEAVAGYFTALPHANYIVMAPSENREFTYRVIFHEYTHYIVNRNFKRLPLWLNEGLADFYSTFAGSEKDGRTIIGRPIDSHIATLLTQSMMPLEKFVSPGAPAELYRRPMGVHLLYAQSWALTHYLLIGNNGARQGQLGAFIATMNRGVPMDRAFREVFGPDLSNLDRELQVYVRQFQLPAIMLDPEPPEAAAGLAPVREIESLQLRADLLVTMGAFELAEAELARAFALEPTFVPARLTRATLRLRQDRHDDALDIASAPDLVASQEFLAHFVRAEALRANEEYGEAIAAYRRAIELQAEPAHAYYGLSLAQLASGDKGAAASFTMCQTLRPDPSWYHSRQIEALRLGLDHFVVSDATNYIRMAGWQGDIGVYVLLPAALTHLRNGDRSLAAETLDDIGRHVKAGSWQAALVGLLRGTVTPAALLAKAKRDDGLLTEAHAYIGILASIQGRKEEALQHLHWVRDKGRKDFIEHGFALGELRRLEMPH